MTDMLSGARGFMQDSFAITLLFAAFAGIAYVFCYAAIAAKRELFVKYRQWQMTRDQRAWDSRPVSSGLINRRVDKEHRSTGRVSRGKVTG